MPKKRTKRITTQPTTLKPTNHTPKERINPTAIRKPQTYEDFFDGKLMMMNPISEEGIINRAKALLYWARNDENALTLSQWFADQGLCNETVKRWTERSVDWRMALELARTSIGARREVLALTRKIDGGMVQYSMPVYSQEWRELVEWKEKVRATYRTAEEAPKIVVIERYGVQQGKDSGVDISVHPESNLKHIVVGKDEDSSKG